MEVYYLNDYIIIDNWGIHRTRSKFSDWINLTDDTHIDYKLDFFENGGGVNISLDWMGPGISWQVIPVDKLFI